MMTGMGYFLEARFLFFIPRCQLLGTRCEGQAMFCKGNNCDMLSL
jgi:hypothetical protein